jgi:hypothetical protein
MSDQPWDRRDGEPTRWYQRFSAFRLAGPGRSLNRVYNDERVMKGCKESHQASGKWREIAKAWQWVDRAQAWDKYLLDMANRQKEAERMAVLADGFGLDHLRVEALKKLAQQLEQWTQENDKVWLPDVKSIGMGKDAERIDLVRFNAALIEQFRGLLSDIADETGGRQRIGHNLNLDLSALTDDELEQIATGANPAKVLAKRKGVE